MTVSLSLFEDQNFSADCILRADFLHRCSERLQSPRLLLAVPNRAFACISRDDPGLAGMMRKMLSRPGSGYPLTSHLLAWEDGLFSVVPPSTKPDGRGWRSFIRRVR